LDKQILKKKKYLVKYNLKRPYIRSICLSDKKKNKGEKKKKE
jgi:hypothetical protein